MELHRRETWAAQGVHLPGLGVPAHLHDPDPVDFDLVVIAEGCEGVVEADPLADTEQIEVPRQTLVGRLQAAQFEAEPDAEYLVTQAYGEQRPMCRQCSLQC